MSNQQIPVKVQWPAKALAADGDDLAPALRSLLEEVRLLETREDETKGVSPVSTPQSLQILTAGSTTITKLYTALATVVGGGAALATGIIGFWNNFEGSPADQAFQRAALMTAAAVLGSAVVIAVSIMVRGDVTARASAQAAAYHSRAEIADAFLRTVESAIPRTAATSQYFVKKGDSWKPVRDFEWEDGKIVAVVDDDRIPVTEMSGLVSSSKLP